MAIEWSEHILISELHDEPQLSEELNALFDRIAGASATGGKKPGTRHVVLNFGGVSYVSSSHLSQLLRLRKKLIDHGRAMVLCSVTDQVQSVISITGLDRVFRFAPDPMTALATLQLEGEPSMGA